jgi:predicted enzyme related to lactoylglutathione lyase
MKDPFKQQGAFSWLELMTTDVDGAKKYYSNLFGWDTEEMPMADMKYTIVKVGEEGLGGIMSIPA